MAIVVDYTPYAAVEGMARQAGINQQAKRQQEMDFQREMTQLQSDLQRKNMEFEMKAQQVARAEEFMYQAKYLTMKREVDIQMELMDYQRNREKLNLALNAIQSADDLSDQEKDELVIQATSKYGNVGSGISPSSFAQKLDPLVRKAMESDLKLGKLNEISQMFNSGQITEAEAQRLGQAYGLGKMEFAQPEEEFQKQMDVKTERLADAQKRLAASFLLDGKKVLDAKTKAKVKPGSPQYELYKTLQRQVDAAREALEGMATSQSHINTQRAEFERLVEASPSLQKAVQLYGESVVFEKWRKGNPAASGNSFPVMGGGTLAPTTDVTAGMGAWGSP
jgi:hypothetical protein